MVAQDSKVQVNPASACIGTAAPTERQPESVCRRKARLGGKMQNAISRIGVS